MTPRLIKSEIAKLRRDVHALAMVGAALRLRQTGGHVASAVRDWLDAGSKAALPASLDELGDEEVTTLLRSIDISFAAASDLVARPDRPLAWQVEQPAALQAQGQASRLIFRAIVQLAESRPSLRAALSGRFLDVGTGVGGIALEAAEQCPALEIVGLDIWEPALTLARAAVTSSPHAARIEIRHLDIVDLDERNAYTLAWLPLPFMSESVVDDALARISVALSPGGHLVTAYYKSPADQVGAAFSALQTLRSGGCVWDPERLTERLRSHGFSAIEIDAGGPEELPASFVLGCRA